MSSESKIFIASKSVAGFDYQRHLYLVYDEDGDLNGPIDDQKIIRGGFESIAGSSSNLLLEVDVRRIDSLDNYLCQIPMHCPEVREFLI